MDCSQYQKPHYKVDELLGKKLFCITRTLTPNGSKDTCAEWIIEKGTNPQNPSEVRLASPDITGRASTTTGQIGSMPRLSKCKDGRQIMVSAKFLEEDVEIFSKLVNYVVCQHADELISAAESMKELVRIDQNPLGKFTEE